MAIARPVRAALIVALLVGGFLILHTLQASPTVKPPPKKDAPVRKGADGVDPNWERKFRATCCGILHILTVNSDWRTVREACASR